MIGRHAQKLEWGIWAFLLWAVLQATMAFAGDVDLLKLHARKSRASAHAMLLDVAAAGTRTIAVGERGVVVYSDDQGRTWQQADVPVSVTLTSVYFVNDHLGWAVGHDGIILHSSDAGETWLKQFDGDRANSLVRADAETRVAEAQRLLQSAPSQSKQSLQQALERAQSSLEDAIAGEKFGPSRPLLGVWFRNEREGFVVGSYGQIFRTVNGGESWDSLGARLSNPEGLHYNAITGTAAGELFIAGEAGKVYHSPDFGKSWRTLDSAYKGQLYGVCVLGQKTRTEILLAYGFGGRIFRSTNRGQAWEQVAVGLKAVPFVGAVSVGSEEVVLAAQDGSLVRSTDGGKTFAALASGGVLPVQGVAKIPDGPKAVVALSGIGGVRFVPLSSTTPGAQAYERK